MKASATDATLTQIADGVIAYLQSDGGWGLSNAGLIVGQTDSLLVDTLFDLAHTRRMLDGFRRFSRRADDASIVVNTHANGDHCFGNELLKTGRIIASTRATREMRQMPPAKLAALMKAASIARAMGPLRPWAAVLLRTLGLPIGADFMDAAPYVLKAFSRFDFRSISFTLPNETFDGRLEIALGGIHVVLLELGPAHTAGDVVAFVPETKTLFAGDLLFEGMHPLVWVGTIAGYIEALERLLSLEPSVVVPGHGKVTDRTGIVRHIDYLRALREQVEPLCRNGATPEQAATTLLRQGFGSLRNPERLIVNVGAAYREFQGKEAKNDIIPMFAAMARLAERGMPESSTR